MSDGFGNPGKNYMLRTFVSIAIAALATAFPLFGFQDSIRSIGGGVALAFGPAVVLGVMTWYNFKHTGDFKKYAVIAAFITDVLAAILIAFMLAHIQVPVAH